MTPFDDAEERFGGAECWRLGVISFDTTARDDKGAKVPTRLPLCDTVLFYLQRRLIWDFGDMPRSEIRFGVGRLPVTILALRDAAGRHCGPCDQTGPPQ